MFLHLLLSKIDAKTSSKKWDGHERLAIKLDEDTYGGEKTGVVKRDMSLMWQMFDKPTPVLVKIKFSIDITMYMI